MKVLLIDDDRNHLESISDALVLNGIETSLFLNPVEALESFYSCDYDAVITDIRMSEMDGMKVLEKILKFDPETHQNMLGKAIVCQSIDQEYHTVWPWNLATRELVWPKPNW